MQKIAAALTLTILFFAGCAPQQIAELEYVPSSNGVLDMTVQVPISPEQTAERLEVPPGFQVRIFAAEPDIRNPIAFSWDERGRLWVVESTNYPHDHVGEESGDDRITICEDTDGDGIADRFTRFAENQPLSTAITVVKGGALVGQAPHIVFMEDTDGDDRFDKKTNLINQAFGTFDTHAVMNNMKYGIDNHVYGAVGYSSMFEQGMAPDEAYETLAMGIFRFSSDGEHLEPMGRFNNNTWGLGIGEDNTIFGSTANNNHAVVIGIPMRYGAEMNVANVQSHFLIKHSASRPLQQVDFRDGYTAAAGAFPYTARRYPESYWGALMVTEPTGHLLHTVHMEPNGSIFKEKDDVVENLLASSDDWVAPVYADIGPDANVWVADWYNPVIQHNPDRRGMFNQIWSDNRGPGNAHLNPLRDKTHGRIYIVDYIGKQSEGIVSIDPQNPTGLLRGIKSSNQFWRLTAQRLIIEHDRKDLAPQLVSMLQDNTMDEAGKNPTVVHALWTLHGLGELTQAVAPVRDLLEHPAAGVRKAALQVLPNSESTGHALMASGVLQDENLNTRLAAVLKVVDLGDAASDGLKAAAENARNGGDEWIDAALNVLNPPPPEPEVAEEVTTNTSGLPVANLTINANPAIMGFQQTELTAYAGQPMHITFNNLHPDLHNVVVLEAGTDVAAFGQALDGYVSDPDAIENEYIPPSQQPFILGSTGIVEKDGVITFALNGLPAGEYTFICTVPGHWAVMQGILRIETP